MCWVPTVNIFSVNIQRRLLIQLVVLPCVVHGRYRLLVDDVRVDLALNYLQLRQTATCTSFFVGNMVREQYGICHFTVDLRSRHILSGY